MKRIIDGKIYDTEKAKLISEYNYSYPSDLNWYEEKLYKKRTGEYFLYGEGGAGSRYSRRYDTNTWIAGSDIRPLTYAEAQGWAEEHMDADAVVNEFGIKEDESTRTLMVSMAGELIDTLKQAAAKKGMTVSAFIAEYAKTLKN